MNTLVIMAIFSALAVGHSLFLARHFWSPIKKSPSSFFLAILLAALAIRILKSVLVILIPKSPDIIPAVGLIGLSAIGPSIWLYVLSYKNRNFQADSRQIGHYIWAFSLIVLIPIFDEKQMYFAYSISVAQMFIYIILTAYLIFKKVGKYNKLESKWLKLLIASISLIWFTFFAQLLIETYITYLLVTVVASVTIYVMSFWAGKKRKLFMEPRRLNLNGISHELPEIGKEIESLLTEKKIYTNSKLTIKKISEKLSQPEYLVSQSINAHFRKSFPEVLNEYRIAHATELIDSKAYENFSLEGIAYESGYNSISAFYRAFKNIKGVTPSKFKSNS